MLDLFLDECVSVAGEVVSHDAGELVVEIDRGEYVQWVRIRGPAEAFDQVSVGKRVQVAGRIGEHEDGGYMTRYGVDLGWWGNLRENIPGGRPRALEPHHRPNPSPPDEAWGTLLDAFRLRVSAEGN